MSFRHYLGEITKVKHEKFKNLSEEEIMKKLKEDCVRPYMIVKEVYELGSYFDDRPLKKELSPFFTNKKTHNKLSVGEECFQILSQKGLATLIDIYHENTAKHYQELQKNIKSLIKGELDDYEKAKLYNSVKAMAREWTDKNSPMNYSPYSLEKDREMINSWRYEYAIFILVRLYREFDFTKKHLILYGY